MEKIEVDGDVFALIQENAVPFRDQPNDVLRRLLGIDPGGPAAKPAPEKAARRASPGSILPEKEYEGPILAELLERGGSGHATEVTDAVGERLADRLTPQDREPIGDGDLRWRSRAQFARLALKKQGLIADDSPRGIWELTDEGRRAAASL